MGQEKIEAATESAHAMAWKMATTSQQFGTAVLQQMMQAAGSVPRLSQAGSLQSARVQQALLRQTVAGSTALTAKMAEATAQVMTQGLRPVHARATANAKRLAKVKRSPAGKKK